MEIPALPLRKPRSLMVFGILNIAVGILGIWGLVQTIMVDTSGNSEAAIMTRQIYEENPGYAQYIKAMTPVAFLATLAVIASAIGLIRGRPWARPLAIGWAVYQLIAAPVNFWATRAYAHPTLLKYLDKGSPDASMAKVMDMVMLSTVVISCALWMAYCLLEIIFLSRGKVKGYLRQQQATRA